MPYKRKMKIIGKKWKRKAGSLALSAFTRKRVKTARKRLSLSKTSINCHSYARWATTPDDISFTASEYDGAYVATFDAIKAYSEFTALYDRYKITKVQLQISLVTNPNSANPTNIQAGNNPTGAWTATTYFNNPTNWYPKFWYIRDYDDSSAISLSVMRERAKVKCFIMQPNKMYKINMKPAILNQTYRTEATTGYSPHWNQWIDMQQTNVPHYGLKYVIDTQGQTPHDYPFKVRMEYRYFFTCKDVL